MKINLKMPTPPEGSHILCVEVVKCYFDPMFAAEYLSEPRGFFEERKKTTIMGDRAILADRFKGFQPVRIPGIGQFMWSTKITQSNLRASWLSNFLCIKAWTIRQQELVLKNSIIPLIEISELDKNDAFKAVYETFGRVVKSFFVLISIINLLQSKIVKQCVFLRMNLIRSHL